MGNRMSVTLISSLSAEGTVPAAPMRTVKKPQRKAAAPMIEPEPASEPGPAYEPEPTFAAEPARVPIATEYATPAPDPAADLLPEAEPEPFTEEISEPVMEEEEAAAVAEMPPPVRKNRKPAVQTEVEPAPAVAPAKKDKFVHARQEVMQFEPVTRGRFEKSEPTIVEGQDLDVPTFLRKNVRVK